MKTKKKIWYLFSDAKIMFYCLIWLVVLLIFGTIAQSKIGVFLATKRFFSSWFVSNDYFLPIPGGRLTIALLSLNLLAKLLFNCKWSLRKLGVNITHLGVFMLLFGSFLTAYFSKEGFIEIAEGEKTGFFSDYELYELAIIETTNSKYDKITSFSSGWLKKGKLLKHEKIPFQIFIKDFVNNTALKKRKIPEEKALKTLWGMAKNFVLQALPPATNDRPNNAGIVFNIEKSASKINDGTYILTEIMPMAQTISIGSRNFTLKLRKLQYLLPFQINLIDFEKKMHPGTNTPRTYKSDILLIEGQVERQILIEMNRPLRKNHYTIFQSGFRDTIPETSIFALVKNKGRVFPYISSIVICIGILLHLCQMLLNKSKKTTQNTKDKKTTHKK